MPQSESLLFALAEASAQYHWGTNAENVEAAAAELRSRGTNQVLARLLQVKAELLVRSERFRLQDERATTSTRSSSGSSSIADDLLRASA